MLIQLDSHFVGSTMLSSTIRINIRRSLSVSSGDWPKLLRLPDCFLCFLNSVMVLAMAALETPSSSAVLVAEAPVIRVPLSISVRSSIVT